MYPPQGGYRTNIYKSGSNNQEILLQNVEY